MRVWPMHTVDCGDHPVEKWLFCPSLLGLVANLGPIHVGTHSPVLLVFLQSALPYVPRKCGTNFSIQDGWETSMAKARLKLPTGEPIWGAHNDNDNQRNVQLRCMHLHPKNMDKTVGRTKTGQPIFLPLFFDRWRSLNLDWMWRVLTGSWPWRNSCCLPRVIIFEKRPFRTWEDAPLMWVQAWTKLHSLITLHISIVDFYSCLKHRIIWA